MNFDIFSNQILLLSIDCQQIFKVYSNQGDNAKRPSARKYYWPKGIIKSYNVIINGKSFYAQVIDPDIKRCKEIRKLTIGQDEDDTTGCLLDCDYVKNHQQFVQVDKRNQMLIKKQFNKQNLLDN